MKDFSFVVLTGQTGSGKTRLLKYLEADNFQVLDLERIAGHRGSVFGASSQRDHSRSQQDFLTALSLQLAFFKKGIPIFTEWKGRKIGSLKIPDFLYEQWHEAPKIWIERDKESRIQELLEVYQDLPIKTLYQALFSLRPKLEEGTFELALQALKERDKNQFVAMMLTHYDGRPEYKESYHHIVKRIYWTTQSIEEVKQAISTYLRKIK